MTTIDSRSRLEKGSLPQVTMEAAEAVDRVVDYAFWQLMLQDDLAVASRDLDLCCAGLKLRMAQVLSAAKYEGREMAIEMPDTGV